MNDPLPTAISAAFEAWQADELPVWNAFVRRFPAATQWQQWGEQILREMLWRPAGVAGHLRWTDVTGRLPAGELEFQQPALWLRSSEESPIAEQCPESFQACILQREGQFFLQNQVGRIATILNREKLLQVSERVLRDGDQIQVFPFELTFSTRAQWETDAEIHCTITPACPIYWQEFQARSAIGTTAFALHLHPTAQAAQLEFPRLLQPQLVAALLAPFGVRAAEELPLAADQGILEYLLLAVLSEAQLKLESDQSFALQAATATFSPATRGVTTAVTIQTSTCAGTIRVFAPFALLKALTALRPAALAAAPMPELTVPRVVYGGWQELSVREWLELEPQDIVLLEPNSAFVSFAGLSLHYHASTLEENPLTMMIEEPFSDADLDLTAGNTLAESAPDEISTGPDPADIPVRLLVILDDRELSYAEVAELVPGSLLTLDREFSGSVKLALNGRVVGEGELVNIEGRIGVKVVRWTR